MECSVYSWPEKTTPLPSVHCHLIESISRSFNGTSHWVHSKTTYNLPKGRNKTWISPFFNLISLTFANKIPSGNETKIKSELICVSSVWTALFLETHLGLCNIIGSPQQFRPFVYGHQSHIRVWLGGGHPQCYIGSHPGSSHSVWHACLKCKA